MLKKLYARFLAQAKHPEDKDEVWMLAFLQGAFCPEDQTLVNRMKYWQKVISFRQKAIDNIFGNLDKKLRRERWLLQEEWIIFFQNDLANLMCQLISPLSRKTLIDIDHQFVNQPLNFQKLFKLLPDCEVMVSMLILLIERPEWVEDYFSLHNDKKSYLLFIEQLVKDIRLKAPLLDIDDVITPDVQMKCRTFLMMVLLNRLMESKNKKILRN